MSRRGADLLIAYSFILGEPIFRVIIAQTKVGFVLEFDIKMHKG